jgi:hypothetical protein
MNCDFDGLRYRFKGYVGTWLPHFNPKNFKRIPININKILSPELVYSRLTLNYIKVFQEQAAML